MLVFYHGKIEKVFPMFRRNLLYFSLCLLPLDTTGKSSVHHSLRYLPEISMHIDEIHCPKKSPKPSLLQAEQSQLSCHVLI